MGKQKNISQYQFCKTAESFKSYIRESDICLRTDEYIIVHLDGVDFTHKYYRQYNSEIKGRVVNAIAESAKEICSKISSIRIAYACSDEVTFILDGKDIVSNNNNRLNKIISKFASMLTLKFYQNIAALHSEEIEKLANNAIFSAKAYNLPAYKIEQYLKWRLMACKKLIFDKKEKYEEKADWEKFGYLICKYDQWESKCIDFEGKKIQKSPQNEFFRIK